jgi:hypothetical protein
MRDCRKATQVIDKLLSSLGLARHPKNGEWVGSTRVEHFGCVIDSDCMRFYIVAKNRQGTWYRASYPAAGSAREAVSFEGQVTIVLWCVRLISLAMPFARFYTRSLFDDMTRRPIKEKSIK